jgi:hypothetical protein
MFIIGLRYWTSPVYLKYTLKLNSLIAPLALVVIFKSSHLDILCLGILVLLMNIYSFWCHIDPPRESYAGGRYTTKRPENYDSDEDIKASRMYDESEHMRDNIGTIGVPPPNYISHYY